VAAEQTGPVLPTEHGLEAVDPTRDDARGTVGERAERKSHGARRPTVRRKLEL